MRNALLGISSLVMLAQSAAAADLTILVTNITEPTGEVRWVLFDSAEHYKADDSALLAVRNRVDGDSMKVTVHDLPAGRYAIKLFHDANNNGELDSNMLGIPTEGYGFSNNAGRFGPPSFEDAAVTVDEDLQIEIRVR